MRLTITILDSDKENKKLKTPKYSFGCIMLLNITIIESKSSGIVFEFFNSLNRVSDFLCPNLFMKNFLTKRTSLFSTTPSDLIISEASLRRSNSKASTFGRLSIISWTRKYDEIAPISPPIYHPGITDKYLKYLYGIKYGKKYVLLKYFHNIQKQS